VNYDDDKWGIIPDPANVAPHVKAMLQSLDTSVGRMMEAVQRLGLTESTLVIFTSDNGGYLDYGPRFQQISSNGIYRGQKTEVYEGGHRVPLIVSWPGRIRTGVTDALTHSNDWMPTLLELAGGASWPKTDGVSLRPILFEEGVRPPDRTLFWRARSGHAARRGSWKLCVVGQQTELYNLQDDPGETSNVAAAKPDVVKELSDAWSAWNTDVIRSAETFVK
jgi:arylsulfatase A-like enzyme